MNTVYNVCGDSTNHERVGLSGNPPPATVQEAQRQMEGWNADRPRWKVWGARHALTPERMTVTHDTSLTAASLGQRLRPWADRNRDRSLTVCLDQARYQKCAWVPPTAAVLQMEWYFRPASPHPGTRRPWIRG